MKFHQPTKIVFGFLGAIIIIGLIIISGFRHNNLSNSEYKNSNPAPISNSEIVITSIRPNQEVTSPIKLEGKAKGNWFFEGSFPVKIIDEDGTVLGSVPVTAQGNWQTEEFVNFSGSLAFKKPIGKIGKIIFSNDNPSGLSQNSKESIIPVRFGITTSSQPSGTCAPNSTACDSNPKLCLELNKNLACN